MNILVQMSLHSCATIYVGQIPYNEIAKQKYENTDKYCQTD